MKNKKNLIVILVGIIAIAAAGLAIYFQNAPKPNKLDKVALPQLTKTVGKDEAEVEMMTTEGNIKIKLFPKLAPKAVENFLTLSKEGYYKNNEFFRVIKDAIIQAGSKDNKASGDSKSIFGKGFDVEKSTSLYNIRGALSLANAGSPGTSASQFFINQNTRDMSANLPENKYPHRIIEAYKDGGNPQFDGNYTVFGQVISGIHVVDKIANAEVKDTTANAGGQTEKSVPVSPVKITDIKVLKSWDFKK